MESRPRIALTLSPLAKMMEAAGWILLVIMWAITIYSFTKMPDQIPSHFNFAGKADSYSDKWGLMVLPIIATVIYLLVTWLNKYPHILNYPIEITEQNAGRQYAIVTGMLRGLKLAIVLVFTLIILFTYLTSIGVANGIGLWFLPLVLALIFVPMIVSIRKMFKN